MTTKEKLDLLWKYLLLAVLVYGFFSLGRGISVKNCGAGYGMRTPHHKMMFMGNKHCMPGGAGMQNVEVRIEKLDNGDSTVVVTVNGETVDLDNFDWKGVHGMKGINIEGLEDMDAQVYVKKLSKDRKRDHKRIKVMKKMVEEDE